MNKATGTREWSNSSVNISSGCSNDCKYCYAKTQAIRFKRKTAENWNIEEIDCKKVEKNYSKRDGVVMFPTTHDITGATVESYFKVLFKLLTAENSVLIVSKPKYSIIYRMLDSLEYCFQSPYRNKIKDRVLFRFTIGSYRDSVLSFWEPGAPPFGDRLASLVECHRRGWKTSVSCEPMLEGARGMVTLVDMLAPYATDSIWLGKMNQIDQRLKMNGYEFSPYSERIRLLKESYQNGMIEILYEALKDHPKVRWKDSIKKVVGLDACEVGDDR